MSTKSIKDPTDRLATMADVLAVIHAASASIAGLELRIQVLEQKVGQTGLPVADEGDTLLTQFSHEAHTPFLELVDAQHTPQADGDD